MEENESKANFDLIKMPTFLGLLLNDREFHPSLNF